MGPDEEGGNTLSSFHFALETERTPTGTPKVKTYNLDQGQ
jgi:hypothetical protein